MTYIKAQDGTLLAKIVSPSDGENGLTWHTDDDSGLQVGTLNQRFIERSVERHHHPHTPRSIIDYIEVIVMVHGWAHVSYWHNGTYIGTYRIAQCETLIHFNGSHAFNFPKGSYAVEVKQGPFTSHDKVKHGIREQFGDPTCEVGR